MLKSEVVKPFRVAESPVQFECKVKKVEALGKEGGAGNLIFSEVLMIHINSAVLDKEGKIDQNKIDQVARMGGNWYTRANAGMFEVPKPLSSLGIGVDKIPDSIRFSKILTGNDLGMLGNIENIPGTEEIEAFLDNNIEVRSVLSSDDTELIHKKAQQYLEEKDIASAWKVLLAAQDL